MKEMEKLRANYNQKVKATMKVVKAKKDDLLSNTESLSSESDEAFVSHSESTDLDNNGSPRQIAAKDYAKRADS